MRMYMMIPTDAGGWWESEMPTEPNTANTGWIPQVGSKIQNDFGHWEVTDHVWNYASHGAIWLRLYTVRRDVPLWTPPGE